MAQPVLTMPLNCAASRLFQRGAEATLVPSVTAVPPCSDFGRGFGSHDPPTKLAGLLLRLRVEHRVSL